MVLKDLSAIYPTKRHILLPELKTMMEALMQGK